MPLYPKKIRMVNSLSISIKVFVIATQACQIKGYIPVPNNHLTPKVKSETSLHLMEKRPSIPYKSRGERQKIEIQTDLDDKIGQENGIWPSTKESLYVTLDILSNIPSLISRNKKDGNDINISKLRSGTVQSGYGDQIEMIRDNKDDKKKSVPDTDLLLRQYEALQREKMVIPAHESNDTETVKAFPKPLSSFDNFKENVYSAADLLSSVTSKTSTKNDEKEEMKKFSSTRSFKATVKPSNNDELNVQIQLLIPKLSSSNPIVRFKTKWKIENLEKQQIARNRKLARAAAFEKTKEIVYSTIDVGQRSIQKISTIPSKITNTAEDSVQIAQNTIAEIEAAPQKIKETKESIQSSFEDAKEITKIVIQDVQNIPMAVQTSVNETSTNVKQQIESVQKTIDDIQQIPQKVKVFTGLGPPSPPPPPPPKSGEQIAKEIALDLSFGLLKLVVKGTWFVGKSIVGLGVNEIKAALDKKKEQVDVSKMTKNRFVSENTVALSKESISYDTEVEITLSDIDPSLGEEVESALQLVQEVLSKPEEKEEESISSLSMKEYKNTKDEFYSIVNMTTTGSSPTVNQKNEKAETKNISTSAKDISLLQPQMNEAITVEMTPTLASTKSPQSKKKSRLFSLFSFFGKRGKKIDKNKNIEDGTFTRKGLRLISNDDEINVDLETSDIDAALKRAREAAERASADAQEIENMLQIK